MVCHLTANIGKNVLGTINTNTKCIQFSRYQQWFGILGEQRCCLNIVSGLYLENDKKWLIKNLCTLEVSSFSIVPINSKLQATQPRCHARFDGRESLSAFMENQFGTIMASRAFSASYAVLFICQIELWSVGHQVQNNITFLPLTHYCLKYCC